MFSARFTASMLCLCLAASPALAGDEIGIAVMEFASKGGISQEQMDALSDMMANEIRGRGGFRVIGKSDIRATLQMMEDKTALGCSDDSCIAELGGALGVRWVVVGNVSLFGKTYLLNLKLLDVEAVKVAWSTSIKVGGGEDKLLDALSGAATDMLAKVFDAAPPDKPAPEPAPAPAPSGTSAATQDLSATSVSSKAPTGRSAFST